MSKIIGKVMKYFAVEENILSIEQPFVFEFGDDKMVLMENVGTFIMPQRLLERVDVWVHEFVEQTLIKKILELDGASEYSVCHGNHSIPVSHILTGLTTGSGWDDKELSPEQFWKILQKKHE